MAPRTARAPMLDISEDDRERPNSCGAQVAAIEEHARQMGRIADALEGFAPAAETVHGFGERLDKFCGWFKGRWPWVSLIVAVVIQRTISIAPNEAPKLIEAVARAAKALSGQ